MYLMLVAWDTSHPLMSSLKVKWHGALDGMLDRSVIWLVSHLEMWPWVASAAVGLLHHSVRAAVRLVLLNGGSERDIELSGAAYLLNSGRAPAYVVLECRALSWHTPKVGSPTLCTGCFAIKCPSSGHARTGPVGTNTRS